jgi:hypothetical protein
MVPVALNDRWFVDFMSEQLTDGRRYRILTVVDDYTRECLPLVADTSLSGARVAREPDRLESRSPDVDVPSHSIVILEHTTWRVLSRNTRKIAFVLRSGAVSLHEVESLKASRACSASICATGTKSSKTFGGTAINFDNSECSFAT